MSQWGRGGLEACRKVQLIDRVVQNEQCLFYSSLGNAGRGLCFSSFTLSIHLISLFTIHTLSLFRSLLQGIPGPPGEAGTAGYPGRQVQWKIQKYASSYPIVPLRFFIQLHREYTNNNCMIWLWLLLVCSFWTLLRRKYCKMYMYKMCFLLALCHSALSHMMPIKVCLMLDHPAFVSCDRRPSSPMSLLCCRAQLGQKVTQGLKVYV